jgi:hypothetical protein
MQQRRVLRIVQQRSPIRPHFGATRTAQSCRSLGFGDAASAARLAVIRRRCEINESPDDRIANIPDIAPSDLNGGFSHGADWPCRRTQSCFEMPIL